LAWTSQLGYSSTSEEVQEEHHYTDDQQDVNEACGNVKGQEPSNQRTIRTAAINPSMSSTPFISERVPIRNPFVTQHGFRRLVGVQI
jgi:hypothetical protein